MFKLGLIPKEFVGLKPEKLLGLPSGLGIE